MTQRYICEATWHGKAGTVATRRWPLIANEEHAAMEEMLAIHAAENESVDIGKGLGSSSFLLMRVTEDEWQALREGN